MWEWLGFLGVGSAGVLGLSAWFLGVPAILGIVNSVLKIVSPLLKGASEFVVWYFEEIWESIKTVYKNPSLMVLLLTIGIVSGGYGASLTKCEKVEIVKEVPSTETNGNWRFNFGTD